MQDDKVKHFKNVMNNFQVKSTKVQNTEYNVWIASESNEAPRSRRRPQSVNQRGNLPLKPAFYVRD